MLQLNKLSVELLANAFTEVEIAQHFPFAVIGQKLTLKSLRKFLLAMGVARKEGRVTLWGCPLIQDEGVAHGCLVLGCHLQRFVPLSHYPRATVTVVDYKAGERIIVDYRVGECPEGVSEFPEVWGLKIYLL